MRFLSLFSVVAVLGLFSGLAFAQVIVPDPSVDVAGWVSTLFKFFAGKEWGLVAGVLTVGIVSFLKWLPVFNWLPSPVKKVFAWLKEATLGKWILNITISEGTAIGAALLARQPINLALIISAIVGMFTSAGIYQAYKDKKGS